MTLLTVSKDGMVELRNALANFLRVNYPDDTEKLTMVYLRFSMVCCLMLFYANNDKGARTC